MTMNYTPYTNSGPLSNAAKLNEEAFHKRLQNLYPCVDDVSKLPQAWSIISKAPPLGLTQDNLGCYFKGNGRREEDEKFAAAVRTDHPIPPSCLLYYFEIRFISKGREGLMGVGLTSAQVVLTKLPGWTRESYGYHADDGNAFNGDGRGNQFGPTFTTDDVIGCGYNLVEGKCFFTKNGLMIGHPFCDIPSNTSFYPTIGLKTSGEEIKANFGQEDFVYDIEQDLRSLRKNMTLTYSNYPINDFSDWRNTLHKLVQSWLLHNSYPDTADAFTKSTKIECKENIQRIQQRKRIQQLVLNGRISEAIRLTNRLFPNLLQNNPNLLFALKCRQFVELIIGAEKDYQPIFNYANIDNASNGLPKNEANGDHPDSPGHLTNNNGCNGMISSNNGNAKINDQQSSSSSSSLQELMDIDQPLTSTSNSNDNNHHRSSTSANNNSTNKNSNNTSNNNNNNIINNIINNSQSSQSQQIINKLDTNTNDCVNSSSVDSEMEDDEQKFARLLLFGRELSCYLQQLDKQYGKNELNEKMLQDAIGLIAFINPRNSCFGKLLDPSEREPISQLLNNSIVKAEMGDSYRPPLDDVMNHLRKLVRLNDSHGGWLVDRLF